MIKINCPKSNFDHGIVGRATSILIFVTSWLKTATYTNESLQSINKKDMIPIVLSLQNKLDHQANNKVLLEEIRKLNENFSKLEPELSVTKQVNSLLLHRLVNMERHCWANTKYSRWECLDIIGIPSEVEPDVSEENVVNIFEKLSRAIFLLTHRSLPQTK